MKIYKGFGLLAFCSLVALNGVRAQSGSAQTVQVQAELPPSQTLPIHVSEAKLQNFDTGSNLDVLLTNVHKAPVFKIWIDVFISNGGSMRRGEQIPVNLADIAPGRSFPMQLTLQSRAHLKPGDTALVVVNQIQGPNGTQQLATDDLNSLLKGFMQGQFSGNFTGAAFPAPTASVTAMPELKFISLSGFRYFHNLGINPECAAGLAAANETCGSRGVHSFSCNAQQGSWSFTCN